MAWREILRNHPHDDICGCSVDETHDDMEVRFTHAQQISAMLEEDLRMELREQMDLSNEDRDAVPFGVLALPFGILALPFVVLAFPFGVLAFPFWVLAFPSH